MSTQIKVALVCEKPTIAHAISPLWQDVFPDMDLECVISSVGVPGGYAQRLPRDMPISAVPAIVDPLFKTDVDLLVLDSQDNIIHRDAKEVLAASDIIVAAVDLDRTGVFGFWNLLRHALGEDAANSSYRMLNLLDMSRGGIEERLKFLRASIHYGMLSRYAFDSSVVRKNMEEMDHYFTKTDKLHEITWTHRSEIRSLIAAGKLKQQFDACWSFNAISLFGPLLANLKVNQDHRFVSKYGLQLLYALKDQDPMTMSEIMGMMSGWLGSGKYQSEVGLGSVTSRWSIIEQLLAAGLIVTNDDRDIIISQKGRDFLSMLHPRCEDADLPFRVEEWIANPATGDQAMRQWINRYFGRQKRHQSK